MNEIKTIVEEVFESKIIGKKRNRTKVNAFKAFCYLVRKHTNKSLNEIGFFIQKDHSTIIYHATNEVYGAQAIAEVDRYFREKLNECERRILKH